MANEKLIDTVGLKYYHTDIASATFQPINSILTSVSGLSTSSTGLVKLQNGTASLVGDGSLNYLPLSGGTMNDGSTIHWNSYAVENTNYNTGTLDITNGSIELKNETATPRHSITISNRSQPNIVIKSGENDDYLSGMYSTSFAINYDSSYVSYQRTKIVRRESGTTYNLTLPLKTDTLAVLGDLNDYLTLSGGTLNNDAFITTQRQGSYYLDKGKLDANTLTFTQSVDGNNIYLTTYNSTSVRVAKPGGTGTYSYLIEFPHKSGTFAITDDIVQSDWDETDSDSKAYILNKPTLGTAAEKNTGTSAGNIPILDSNGKLSSSILPSIALTETYVVADQAAMLALDAQVGDVCVVTGENKTYILATAGASVIGHWQEIVTPSSAGFVTSVNNQTGTVTLTASDVGAVATTASQGLTSTQQSNARANIGAMLDQGWQIADTTDIDAIFA